MGNFYVAIDDEGHPFLSGDGTKSFNSVEEAIQEIKDGASTGDSHKDDYLDGDEIFILEVVAHFKISRKIEFTELKG